jgi:hypothetical protein
MDEKAIATLATEALKPVSRVIDALLAPKLERMRIQAKKRELINRLQDPVVNKLLDNYFKRLLRYVSGITTIVFPQQVLPVPKIYEPLSLEDMIGREGFEDQITLTATDLKPGHSYFIIDSAGMGKSTFAKHLVLDIFHSTVNIPLFLELRRIEESESLLGRLSKEIDEEQDDIDEKFLRVLLDQGGYVIILDGYDELTKDARERIREQITNITIRYLENSLVLTSRPEVTLPGFPLGGSYRIQPLERAQAESLVLRYDAVANIEVGKGLIGEFENVSEEFLRTPLLLVLLYRTYGYNHSIASNVNAFYDDVYAAFYKGHDLSKAGFSRDKLSGLDSENFRRLLRGLAFLLLMENRYSLKTRTEGCDVIEKAMKFTSIMPSSASAYFDDLLVSVPLLVSDGTQFRFIHKSIVEFFAAEYLASVPNAEKNIKMIRDSYLSDWFINSFDFLAELNPSLFRRSILAPLARKFLVTKNLFEDPLLRTLSFCEFTHIGIIPADGVFEGTQTRWDRLGGRPYAIAHLDQSYRLVFIRNDRWEGMSAKVLEFLSKPRQEYDPELYEPTGLPWPEKKIPGLPASGRFFSLSSKALLGFFRYEPFRNSAARVLRSMPWSSIRTLDDDACKSVLTRIREERKAQNLIENIIARS